MDKAGPKPPHADATRPARRRKAALQASGALYLLLRQGWTVTVRAPTDAERRGECVRLVKRGRLVEEAVDPAVMRDLGEWFAMLLQDKALRGGATVALEQADLVPPENSSETVSEDHGNP